MQGHVQSTYYRDTRRIHQNHKDWCWTTLRRSYVLFIRRLIDVARTKQTVVAKATTNIYNHPARIELIGDDDIDSRFQLGWGSMVEGRPQRLRWWPERKRRLPYDRRCSSPAPPEGGGAETAKIACCSLVKKIDARTGCSFFCQRSRPPRLGALLYWWYTSRTGLDGQGSVCLWSICSSSSSSHGGEGKAGEAVVCCCVRAGWLWSLLFFMCLFLFVRCSWFYVYSPYVYDTPTWTQHSAEDIHMIWYPMGYISYVGASHAYDRASFIRCCTT